MAGTDHRLSPRHDLPLILAGAAIALHYGWTLAPAEHQAQVWNAAGAIARAALLWAALAHFRMTRTLAAVALWWIAEEAMVATCSTAFIFAPWHVPPGAAQCSALLQFDLGKVGAATLVAILATVRPYR